MFQTSTLINIQRVQIRLTGCEAIHEATKFSALCPQIIDLGAVEIITGAVSRGGLAGLMAALMRHPADATLQLTGLLHSYVQL